MIFLSILSIVSVAMNLINYWLINENAKTCVKEFRRIHKRITDSNRIK